MGLILPFSHFIVLLHFLPHYLSHYLFLCVLLQSLRLLLHPAFLLKPENLHPTVCKRVQVVAHNILECELVVNMGNSE